LSILRRFASDQKGNFAILFGLAAIPVVGAIGILNHMRILHLRLGVEDFWLVAGSLILLLLANLMRGL